MDTRRPRFRNLARGTPKDEKKSKIKSGSPTHSRFNFLGARQTRARRD